MNKTTIAIKNNPSHADKIPTITLMSVSLTQLQTGLGVMQEML